MKAMPNDMPWCALELCMGPVVSIFFGEKEKYPWSELTGLEIIPVLNSSLERINQFDEGRLFNKSTRYGKDMSGSKILQVLKDINEVFEMNIKPATGLSII